jgi:hypothetical protein
MSIINICQVPFDIVLCFVDMYFTVAAYSNITKQSCTSFYLDLHLADDRMLLTQKSPVVTRDRIIVVILSGLLWIPTVQYLPVLKQTLFLVSISFFCIDELVT